MRRVPAVRPVVMLLTLLAGTAAAAPASRPQGAEVQFGSSTTVVDVGGVEHDLDSTRVLLDYSEPANGWLRLGFTVGLTFDSMPSQALVAATDPSGYAAGLFAGVRPFERGPFAIDLELRVLRDHAEGGDGSSDSELDYTESSARLGASWRFSGVEVEAGAYALEVEGDIVSTGVVVGSADFSGVESGGAYAALRLPVSGGYMLGVAFESGARDTLAVTFAARF